MIDATAHNNTDVYDHALLRAVALSLNPRLQPCAPDAIEAENGTGPDPSHHDRSAGGTHRPDNT